MLNGTPSNSSKVTFRGFHAIVAYKNSSDFVSVLYSSANKCWAITHSLDGSETYLAIKEDASVRCNVFVKVLLQVRGKSLSVDVNESPVFTNVTRPEAFQGFPGLRSEGSRFAVKQWRLRGNFRFAAHWTALRTEGFPATAPAAAPAMDTAGSRSLMEVMLRRHPRPPSAAEPPPATVPNPPNNTAPPYPPNTPANVPIPPYTPASVPNPPNTYTASPYPPNISATVPIPPNTPSTVPIPPNAPAAPPIAPLSHEACHQELLQRGHCPSVVACVMRDVVRGDLGVTFADIASLGPAKRLLHEAVILPVLMPELFTGIRTPWKGVLLFGPPGTGKTLLAKAVCSSQQATFFSCAASSLVSKYRGESEKIVRCLFEAARLCAPSAVFLDEVDALVSEGSGAGGGQHEASRRLQTEFFSQMDGLRSACPVSQRVLVLGATNCPWALDPALLRRLEKRIYVPLPDSAARGQLFGLCLRGVALERDLQRGLEGEGPLLEALALRSRGFSGADILVACKEASMQPVRRLLEEQPQQLQALRAAGQLHLQVSSQDLLAALDCTRPSVPESSIARFEMWDRTFSNT